MKVLSIIGMIISLLGVSVGFAIMNIYEIREGGAYLDYPAQPEGLFVIVTNLFFLAFSITATVVSFRKKKETR